MTQYIDEPTDEQMRRWSDSGKCHWCGTKKGSDLGKCLCRWCESCCRVWLSDVRADYRDEDYGPVSRHEDCPDCQPTFARVKEAICIAYKASAWGSYEETYYFDALTEMILLEREIEEAELCLRHRGRNRYPGGFCRDCKLELGLAA